MIVCEYMFDESDKKRPEYSMMEIEYYSRLPSAPREKNHRLSLRKNLRSNKFEVYRYYYWDKVEEVIFEGSLKEALEFACNERNKIWGIDEVDEVCKHDGYYMSYWCPRGVSSRRGGDPLMWVMRQLRR